MGGVLSSSSAPNGTTTTSENSTSSSTLFKNARLVDKEGTFDVLISQGTIVSIRLSTPSPQPTASISASTETIDLGSKYFIAPSLVDHHVHFSAWTLNKSRLDLSTAKSAKQAVQLVKERLEQEEGQDEKEPFVARDFRVGESPITVLVPRVNALMSGTRVAIGEWPDIEDMTKETLDAISSERPIALISGDLHSIWLNTPGLLFVGAEPTKETGVLFEKTAFNALNKVNDIPAGKLDILAAAAAQDAA